MRSSSGRAVLISQHVTHQRGVELVWAAAVCAVQACCINEMLTSACVRFVASGQGPRMWGGDMAVGERWLECNRRQAFNVLMKRTGSTK